jgi:hypothetical protein
MRRRALIAIVGTGLVMWPLVARAQQQARSARLGYLGFGSPKDATVASRIEALRAGCSSQHSGSPGFPDRRTTALSGR